MTRNVLQMDALPDKVREAVSDGVQRTYCPQCDGGKSHEQSLSIRQDEDGVLRLRCWRATCGWFATSLTNPDARLISKQIKEARPYRQATTALDESETEEYLCDTYGLRPSIMGRHGWRTNERETELVLPVLDMYGRIRGHITRTFDSPKRCFTYKETAQPFLDYWPVANDTPVVIVEDCLSACRLAGLGYNAVALLGTSMSIEQAHEIHEWAGGREVMLALDADAFEKALILRKRFAHILRMKVILLTQDIKNVKSDDDIRKLLGS